MKDKLALLGFGLFGGIVAFVMLKVLRDKVGFPMAYLSVSVALFVLSILYLRNKQRRSGTNAQCRELSNQSDATETNATD